MNNPDRRKQILDILEAEGEINTTVLSTRLGVTGATIRTDIRALEREGAIVRFHGGIKLPHKMSSYSGENYMVRAVTHVDLKNAIGQKAASLVANGNTIFMDASSTTFHMIPYLKKAKDVTVITNGIHTAMELQRNSNFKSIIILGGMLRPHSGAIEGLSSKEMIGLTPPPEDVHTLLNEVEVVFQRSIVGDNATCLLRPHRLHTCRV